MPTPSLPTGLLPWLLALTPIVVLLLFLLVLRWSAPEAGAVGVLAAAAVALLAFRMTPTDLATTGAKGLWDGVFILYVVWPALLLYRVVQQAGAFEALRAGLTHVSANNLFLVLAFGWVFVSFLQGITGFGTPVAMVAPLMLALGVRPLYAVAIPLVGHAWGNMFGTLSVAWLATTQVVALTDPASTAFQAALLLWLPQAAAGLVIAWWYGRAAAVRHALPLILVVSALHGGLQLALVGWNAPLSNFLAVLAGFAALVPLARLRRYADPAPLPPSPIFDHAPATDDDAAPTMGLALALLPYALLTVVAVGVLVPPPVAGALGGPRVGLAFAATETGYGVARAATAPYAPFAPLTHPGTFLLLTAIATYSVYRARGCYRQALPGVGRLLRIVTRDAVPSSLAVLAFLVLSKIMDHSGQTDTLALGIAAVTPPLVYAVLAAALGCLGAFMTSSNTASNVLFAPVQQTLAATLGLPEASIVASQSAGAAVGNAVSPANAVLGTGPVGILGEEGAVIRITTLWTLALTLLVGVATLGLVLLNGGAA